MSNPYFGVDLGTGNCSVAYVVDDPRMADQQYVRVDVVMIPMDDVDGTESPRMPTVLAVDWTKRTAKKPLFGWSFVQAFRKPRRNAPMLRREVDYFGSVKSEMGTQRVYPFSKIPGTRTPAQVTAQILARVVVVRELHAGLGSACGFHVIRAGHEVIVAPPAATDGPDHERSHW